MCNLDLMKNTDEDILNDGIFLQTNSRILQKRSCNTKMNAVVLITEKMYFLKQIVIHLRSQFGNYYNSTFSPAPSYTKHLAVY